MKNTPLTSNLPHHTCTVKMHQNGPLEISKIIYLRIRHHNRSIFLYQQMLQTNFSILNTLNLLHNARFDSPLSAYAYVYGPYNFNKYPMAPPVTRVVFHKKSGNCTSWGFHGTPGWYIVPSLKHYRCIHCYMPATAIVCITETLQSIPKACNLPKTANEDYLQQAIGDILEIMQDPPNTLPFLSYVNAKKM